MTESLTITPFTEDHLDGAVALSQAEGWPHRRADWDMNRRLSAGFVITDGARVLGTIFATPFGASVATINMVIVEGSLRGKGMGKRLMDTAFQAIAGKECRLVATREGLPLYEKTGFVRTGEIVQHQGPLDPAALPTDGLIGVTPARSEDLPAILEMDRTAQGADRSALIAALTEAGTMVVTRRADGTPKGYACLRPFGRGDVAGPVIADTLDDAKAMLTVLLAPKAGAFIRVDTDAASGLAPWLAELGLAHAGGGVRMVRPAPGASAPATSTATPYVFALASQALG